MNPHHTLATVPPASSPAATLSSLTLYEPHRTFCNAVAAGFNATDAYALAYPGAANDSTGTLGSRLIAREHIRMEIARLRAEADESPGSAVLTLAEKRSFLARVVRARIALLPEDSDLWQNVKRTRDGLVLRLADKLGAIRRDNALAGHGSGVGSEKDPEKSPREITAIFLGFLNGSHPGADAALHSAGASPAALPAHEEAASAARNEPQTISSPSGPGSALQVRPNFSPAACNKPPMPGPQRKFCEGIVAGLTITGAYMAAYPEAKRSTASSAGSALFSKSPIRAEIARLRAKAGQAGGSDVLTVDEKRRFLAGIVRARPALIPGSSDLWCSMRPSGPGVEFRLPDKNAAIQLDEKLARHAASPQGPHMSREIL